MKQKAGPREASAKSESAAMTAERCRPLIWRHATATGHGHDCAERLDGSFAKFPSMKLTDENAKGMQEPCRNHEAQAVGESGFAPSSSSAPCA